MLPPSPPPLLRRCLQATAAAKRRAFYDSDGECIALWAKCQVMNKRHKLLLDAHYADVSRRLVQRNKNKRDQKKTKQNLTKPTNLHTTQQTNIALWMWPFLFWNWSERARERRGKKCTVDRFQCVDIFLHFIAQSARSMHWLFSPPFLPYNLQLTAKLHSKSNGFVIIKNTTRRFAAFYALCECCVLLKGRSDEGFSTWFSPYLALALSRTQRHSPCKVLCSRSSSRNCKCESCRNSFHEILNTQDGSN